MAEELRIALAGLGTVGAGLVRLIETNGALIERRAGRPVSIVAVSARDRAKDRGVDLSPYIWEDDMTALSARANAGACPQLTIPPTAPSWPIEATSIERSFMSTTSETIVGPNGK